MREWIYLNQIPIHICNFLDCGNLIVILLVIIKLYFKAYFIKKILMDNK